jgi:hypothetical protein
VPFHLAPLGRLALSLCIPGPHQNLYCNRMATPPDVPQAIVLTDEERDSGVMSDKKLYDAIEAFFTDGLVVVENAIDVAIIDKLNERMLQDTEKLLKGQGYVHFK